MVHIHVMGASGSGTTTLGKALADILGIRHIDSDDIFWLPTNPPYTAQRPIDDRIAMLQEFARPDSGWVLSGSALKWGSSVEPLYDLIVFLRIDPAMRMERIRHRETERYGERIAPGGDMAAKSAEFLEWAARYDTAGIEQRSLVSHEQWLATQKAPILRLDSAKPVGNLTAEIIRFLPTLGGSERHAAR